MHRAEAGPLDKIIKKFHESLSHLLANSEKLKTVYHW